ncbi:MAG: CDP-alcohol phosphatidyltransferase family protein [Myxococcota bacterium]
MRGEGVIQSEAGSRSMVRAALAWGVHAFTALGAVVGTGALLSLGVGNLRSAALLMLLALFIDCVDGSLARAARVQEHAARLDGRRLDDIIDFLNYVVVAVVFLVVSGALLHPALVALPVLASCYGFCQADAKTDDDFFLGFPSYWNVVALYLWLFETAPEIGSALVVALSVLVFVPLKYLYPSRMKVFYWTTNVGGALWMVALGACVAWPERVAPFHVLLLSLFYPAYYIGGSLWFGGMARRRA